MSGFPRKILISSGYGAGWSTWGNDNQAKFACEYKPIIQFLENGGKFDRDDLGLDARLGEAKLHPLLVQFLADLAEFEGEEDSYFYLGGACGLRVVTVNAPYRVEEYDGFESVRTQADTDFIS